ncbi:hypothetical protein GXB81_19715 [Paraburkholderia sp. Ac-20336]|uniref:hypothetical protein n=1 Tax=Burkholderiaceae TaxID=119060 RepID=UPI001423FE5E|nr:MULTISPECIES: hypothetical protein [Burkholderiaceae]MBN3805259.1 hypothetical protein [Paraburkholderia sp. Ac-20336]NIF54409.1 hypothetical protein [Burkholderia sp. Ax-1724]
MGFPYHFDKTFRPPDFEQFDSFGMSPGLADADVGEAGRERLEFESRFLVPLNQVFLGSESSFSADIVACSGGMWHRTTLRTGKN